MLSPIDASRRNKRKIGILRDNGKLNPNWSVARDIFLLRIQTENPYPRPDVQEMMAIAVYREAYGKSGDHFDFSEIGDIEIRMVRNLPSYTGSELIFGHLVGGSNIHRSRIFC